MKLKVFELRDRATFIPIMAVSIDGSDTLPAIKYLLGSAGYRKIGDDPKRWVILSNLTYPQQANFDPHRWDDRTYQTAHLYIMEHFDEIPDGAVVDVEFILGETPRPKESQRLSSVHWKGKWE